MCWTRFLVAFAATSAGALVLGCAPRETDRLGQATSALGQPLRAEIEPNDTPDTATPLSTDGVVRANLARGGDEDVFSFPGAPGDRVFAATVTAFSSDGTLDTTLDLIGPDGATVLESDNDDGTLGTAASSLAGAALTDAGTHYLRVRHPTLGTLRPYDLHIKVQSGVPAGELEPNDLPDEAQPLPASGWVSGAISSASDVDLYSLSLAAGDTVFASLDLDPERDGTALGGALSLGPFAAGSITVNDLGGGPGPSSEALVATVKSAGTYRIGVSSPTGPATGNYQLSVSVHPAPQASCTTYSSDPGAVIAIPVGLPVVSSPLSVPGNPRVQTVDVTVNLTHAHMPDLDVILESPQGTQVGLFSDIGSGAYPDMSVTFSDDAAFPVSYGGLLTGLFVQPEAAYRLDWLRGQDAGGTWTLRIADDSPSGAGTLTSWRLRVCEPPPPPTCSGGAPQTPLFETDFEAGDAGFTHSGPNDDWARGTPAQTGVFDGCHSGAACFKTNLTGDYSKDSSQDLVSPPISLAGVTGPITVTWAMKYQMETSDFDHATVSVREVGGATLGTLFEWMAGTMRTTIGSPPTKVDEVAGWGIYSADVSEHAGKDIELVFHVDSDASTGYAGMGIDDVRVLACPTQPTTTGAGGAPSTSTGAATTSGTSENTGGSSPTGTGQGGDTTGTHATTGTHSTTGTDATTGTHATGAGGQFDRILPGGGMACALSPARRSAPDWAPLLALAPLALVSWRRRLTRRTRRSTTARKTKTTARR